MSVTSKVWVSAARMVAHGGVPRKPEPGCATELDYAEAVKWFRLASEQGYAEAQSNLGVMYDEGRGVPQDYVQAYMWFDLAAARYSASEAGLRDGAVKNRDWVASKMTPAQIAEAQRLAREWKPR